MFRAAHTLANRELMRLFTQTHKAKMYSCLTLTHTRAAQSVEEFRETKKYYEKETFHRKQLETSRLEMDRDTHTRFCTIFKCRNTPL